ncbi:MAG: M48 family metallopeptidase [Alphaproteobacteria bacterium]|nr:M48 family metallopeptidase [Alphaproteobacteria bacterium]
MESTELGIGIRSGIAERAQRARAHLAGMLERGLLRLDPRRPEQPAGEAIRAAVLPGTLDAGQRPDSSGASTGRTVLGNELAARLARAVEPQAQEPAPICTVQHGGRAVPVHAKRHERARRIILRVDAARDRVELVLPMRSSMRSGMTFLQSKQDWLAERLAEIPARVPLADGALVPVRGQQHAIRHRAGTQGGAWIQPAGAEGMPEIHVAGRDEHVARRVIDLLRVEARRDLVARTRDTAAKLGRNMPRVTLRDTVSRWGSCSRSAGIAYCWRLIMMPDFVRDYVVAHEVGHLDELNHSSRFWAIVDRLTPHRAAACAWLQEHGTSVHRYG